MLPSRSRGHGHSKAVIQDAEALVQEPASGPGATWCGRSEPTEGPGAAGGAATTGNLALLPGRVSSRDEYADGSGGVWRLDPRQRRNAMRVLAGIL
jgi:hypothetical protein